MNLLQLGVKCYDRDRDGNTPFNYIFMSLQRTVEKYGDMHLFDALDYAHKLLMMLIKNIFRYLFQMIMERRHCTCIIELPHSFDFMLFINDA